MCRQRVGAVGGCGRAGGAAHVGCGVGGKVGESVVVTCSVVAGLSPFVAQYY